MGNRLLDASTTLLGWVNYSAEPHVEERVIAAGTAVKLTTPLDAAGTFTFLANHPGHSDPITYTLELAPERRDGTIGTWFQAAEVAIPAAGGTVEAPISGAMLQIAAPDAPLSPEYSVLYARVSVAPSAPDGAYAGLTFH
jgi:hypothetical protein